MNALVRGTERLPDGPALLTMEDVARELSLGRSKIFEMAARGELPAPIRLGRNVRISRMALERWIEERQADAEAVRA